MKLKAVGLTGVVIVLIVAAMATVSIRRQVSSFLTYKIDGRTMGTTYTIKLVGDYFSKERLQSTKLLVEEGLESINLSMSRYRPDSEISALNFRQDHVPLSMSSDIIEVLLFAEELSGKTDGAFDVTIGPLVGLWGFHGKRPLAQLPPEAVIQRTRSITGYEKLVIDSEAGTVFKVDANLEVDLSSIAKGRGVDKVVGILSSLGYVDYMVEIGGEVRSSGVNARGTSWKIGIEKPNGGTQEVLTIVELSGKSMATSGDYRSFFELQSKRYSHTIDPRTGHPINHNLVSVTIVHDQCMAADAIATALTVLGLKEGFELAEKEQWAAFFITRNKDNTFSTKSTTAFNNLRNSDI